MKNLTAREWLNRFDQGHTVTTVEMGGLGPHYEQAIQETAAEVLRELLDREPDVNDLRNWWKKNEEDFREVVFERLPKLADGLSGAQWGAALNLGFILYRRGPEALNDEEVLDRQIEIHKVLDAE